MIAIASRAARPISARSMFSPFPASHASHHRRCNGSIERGVDGECRIAARQCHSPGGYPWTKCWVGSQDKATQRQGGTHYNAALRSFLESLSFACTEGRAFNKTCSKCAFCDLPETAPRSSDGSMRDAPSDLRETQR